MHRLRCKRAVIWLHDASLRFHEQEARFPPTSLPYSRKLACLAACNACLVAQED